MAWISGLADKAENILNKIDKNAATALLLNTPDDESASYKRTATILPENTLMIAGVAYTDSVESKGEAQISAHDAVAIDVDVKDRIGYNGHEVLNRNTLMEKISSTDSDSHELAAFKIALTEVSNERDELRLRLTALNNDLEKSVLQQRVQELEMFAYNITQERDKLSYELSEANVTCSAYIKSLSEMEASVAKLQQECLELAQKSQMQQKETELQCQELNEYRTKAQRSLFMKDSIIAELKTKKSESPGDSINEIPLDNSKLRMLQLEFEALKLEHQLTLTEKQQLALQLEETRVEWNVLCEQHANHTSVMRDQEESLRKELRVERERLLAIESEQRLLQQERLALREQLTNQQISRQEKAAKLQHEENKICPSNEISIDTRVMTLTQALVDKQNEVENVTADRNALRIQSEKLQEELRQTIFNYSLGHNFPRNALLSNSTDDAKAQFPPLMKANPFDNRVARRVKRAYSSLDSAGIRLGAFLRRYPLMRILVLVYVAMLHIWVMFVLLSSTPN